MKSKRILSLLGLYFSVACVSANPTYNVTIPPGTGYTLFADQLALSPDDLANTALGQMLSKKAQVIVWDVPSQTFVAYSKGGSPPTWSADPTLSVGEGFYARDPDGATPGPLVVPFSGAIISGDTPITIPGFSPTTLWYLLGSQTYVDPILHPATLYNYYDITGYSTPMAGLSLYRARNAQPGGTLVNSLPPTDPTDWNEYWYDGTWHPFDPAIYLAEAVWIGPSSCAIEGTVTDNNGVPLPNWEMALSDGQYTFTDGNGNYRFAVSASGEYTVSQIPSCGYDTLTDPQTVTVDCSVSPVQVPPFRAIKNGINTGPDLAIIVTYVPDPGNPNYPCPNDTGYYSIRYFCKCGSVGPGSTLSMTLPTTYVTYGTVSNPGNPAWSQTLPISGSPATPGIGVGPLITGGNTLNWTLGAMSAGDIGEIRIPIQVNGNVATGHPYTSLGTYTVITAPAGVTESTTANNLYNYSIPARCSFDPNDKTVAPAGCGPAGLINGNQPLTYTVQFQNLGSAPAFDVVVTDQLDPSLDSSTLEIVGASHNYIFQLNGNQMTWTFQNIYLPDAAENEPGSHGFLVYRINLLPGLADGTVITNQASIVFDKNPPVLTAITTNTITSETLPSASFTVTPRPGSAGHTNDFTYTGGTVGATFLWDFGSDAIPPSSTNMNPSGVVFPADGLKIINLQVFTGDCTATPASYLLSVGQPKLSIASNTGNQVVLSWQGDAYSLQAAGNLSTPIPWQTISPTLTQVGATHFASLAATNTTIFYRLTDQP